MIARKSLYPLGPLCLLSFAVTELANAALTTGPEPSPFPRTPSKDKKRRLTNPSYAGNNPINKPFLRIENYKSTRRASLYKNKGINPQTAGECVVLYLAAADKAVCR
jgi:hypothetical protein